jgi:hypothetical protein
MLPISIDSVDEWENIDFHTPDFNDDLFDFAIWQTLNLLSAIKE